jgi:pyridoxamine 5'-phosphate oxidase
MNLPLPSYYDDLALSLTEAFSLMSRGVADRHSAFHQPTIISTGVDGRPRARTVTLRAFDRSARTIRFHCDRRSEKLLEIAKDARMGVHIYSKQDKIQVRIDGTATVHHADAVADTAWAGSRVQSRQCYGIEPPQGQVLDQGGAYSLPEIEEQAVEIGRRNFCAVLISIQSLEWLYLAGKGHRRALFSWQDDTLTSRWLAP